jgi:hypothetical protein
MDRIWIDLQDKCALRRREYHLAPDKPLDSEILNGDFREVKPGIWLPFTQRVTTYGSVIYDRESMWGQVKNRTAYRTVKCECDNVQDSLFSVRLPVGTGVVDLLHGSLRYKVSREGADPIEEPISAGKEYLAERTGPSRAWVMVVGSLVIVLIAIFIYRRSS